MAKKSDKKKTETEDVKNEKIDELVSKGKKQGYLTLDQISEVLPEEMMSPDQIDETLMWFDDRDIEVVEKRKNCPHRKQRMKMIPIRFQMPMKSIPCQPTVR